MKPTAELDVDANWPPREGEIISFRSLSGLETAILKQVRWGLVWRDFILQDGRVVPEHKVIGCPEPAVWRKSDEVSQEEREEWERRLVSMAEAGLDPRDQEQALWAELNQYLAYTYLRFKRTAHKSPEAK